MPQNELVPAIIQAASFQMEANPDSIKGVQASETFKVTAKGDGCLSEGGEQVGFAKYQFDNQKFEQLKKESIAWASVDSDLRPLNSLKSLGEQIENTQNELARLPPADQQTESQKQEAAQLQADLQSAQDQMPGKIQAAVTAIEKSQQKYPALNLPGLDATADPLAVAREASQLKAAVMAKSKEVSNEFSDMNKVGGVADNLWGNPDDPAQQQKPDDRGLLARQVASHEVDKFIGIQVIAPEKFGIDADGRPIGISVQADGAGITGKHQGKDSLLDVNLSDPNVQRGLSDLEVMDYITGQIDRHAGNMFVDTATGKVTGIDNDLAFPEISRDQMLDNAGEYVGKMVGGMPQMIHQETADKLLAASPDALRQQLKNMPVPAGVSPLGNQAIEGAVKRLQDLQAAVQDKNSGVQVVKEFNDKTFEQSMKAQSRAIGVQDIRTHREEIPRPQLSLPKQSYVGAAAVQAAQYQTQMILDPSKIVMRTDSPLAQRNSEGLKDVAKDIGAKMQPLQDQMQKQREHLEKVQAGGMKAVAARVRYGSEASLETKLNETLSQLQKAEQQVDRLLKQGDISTQQEIGKEFGRKIEAPPAPSLSNSEGPTQKEESHKTKLKTREAFRNTMKDKQAGGIEQNVDEKATRAAVKREPSSTSSDLKVSGTGIGSRR